MPPSDPSSAEQIAAIVMLITFPTVSLIVVCIRVAGRASSRQFGLDDSLICIAMVLSLVETAASYMYIKTNFIGIKMEQIPVHDPVPGLVWNYAVQILYNPILALVKTSILLFLKRLFGQKPGVRHYIVWVNTANIASMVAFFFSVLFQCIPIEKSWDLSIRGSCVDRRILFTTMSSFNILTDLLVLGLPLRIFIGLKIPRQTKIALMFVFLLGFLVTITSIVRLALLVQGLFMLKSGFNPDGSIGFVTSAIETNLVLITASAPALRPLLRAWFPKIFGIAREELEGATERKVLGTTATHMTRIKSQSGTQLPNQTSRVREETAISFEGIACRSDITFHFDPKSARDLLDVENNRRMGKRF